MSGGIALAAPAKINLFLHVVGKRQNDPHRGYHQLESLAVFAQDEAACDSLLAEPADQLSLTIDGPFATALNSDAPNNLVLRAARALAEQAGIAPRAKLTLTKRLPVASGIGGGSADAAAALKALRRLWRLDLDDAALAAIGLRLGADIPVCLQNRPMLMQGIGDILQPVPALPACWLVLANPGVSLATKDVFAALGGRFGPSQPLSEAPASAADLAIQLRARRNDLEAPARFLAAEIDPVLAALRGQGGCLLARLSGSGATCFGLFGEARLAQIAAQSLARAHPAWWVAATAI
ncbi:4-(cytidine 5'-diphospho)-2-C-methyl-D-erythritol kinase [Ferrovibrio sp.]|uniref:4-(cytidine 5'-diphospho)-2-C-methyl-D-erythritol kinase n=1 Tax=Ferrovibrio sp. TaxID=1917215 RepID=UPI0035AFB043